MVQNQMRVITRTATPGDISQVHAILSHYVLNSTADMHHIPPSLNSLLEEFETILTRGLPYLVAVSLPDLDDQMPGQDRILGFIHAFPFRGYKVGYSFTAELAIMCHQDYIKCGVGGTLMAAFLDALEKGGRVEQILAFMTILDTEEEDQRVKGFYEKWRFREVGIMENVGQKFGKRLSKRWMQRSVILEES